MASDDQMIVVRMRLQDVAKFVGDAELSAAAVKGISSAADTTSVSAKRTGGAFDTARVKSFLWTQTLYTMRRGLFATTLALGTVGAAAIKMGFSFNSSMEQSRIAFTQLLGSSRAAQTELGSLYHLAAVTPFEFTQVTSAAQKFLAFGYTLQQTNKYLRILGDTAAGLGMSGQGVEQLAIIFGQIRASGRLLGQDMLQLEQAGVPALDILTKQLHLTQTQVKSLLAGTLQIPSSVAIPALFAGLQGRYGGLAAKQAGTFQGLTSTLHDFAAQMTGTLTFPLFTRTESFLKTVTDLLPKLNTTLKQQGFTAMIAQLDASTNAGGRLTNAWLTLSTAATNFWRILTQSLLPAIGTMWRALDGGRPFLGLLTGALSVLARHTTLVKAAFVALFTYAAARRIFALAGLITDTLVTSVATLTLTTEGATGAMLGLDAAMDANPIGVIILAVAGLAIGLEQLIVHWNAVRDAFVYTGQAMVRGFIVMGDAIKRAWDATIGWIIRQVENLARFVSGAFHGIFGVASIPGKIIGSVSHAISFIPGLAAGGVVTTGGSVIVGERGPELLNLGGGAVVQPLPHPATVASLTGAAASAHAQPQPLGPIVIELVDRSVHTFEVDGVELARAETKRPEARTILAQAVFSSRKLQVALTS